MLKGKMFILCLCVVLTFTLMLGCNSNKKPVAENQKAETKKEETKDKTPKSEDAIVLKLGHVVAEKTAIDMGAREFGKLVKEKSDGNITVEIYPSATLGGNREMLEGMQLGTIDLITPSLAPLSGFTDKTLIFDLPYLFKDNESAEKVLDGEVGTQVLKDLEGSGFIGLCWMTQSWRQLSTSDTEVHTPADAKGLKIRVMDNPLHIAHFNTIGASAVPMAFSEVFTSLQQGVIDGQENPYVNIKLSGFNEVQKYVIETKHIYDPIPLLLSKITWDKMSDNQKNILKEAAEDAKIWQRNFAAEQDKEIKQEFLNSGKTEIIELSEEERNEFLRAAQPVYKNWESKVGKELIQQVIDSQK